MAKQDSLGLVEVMGFAAAVEVADVMVKTAWVKVKTVCNADAGMLAVVCEGDLAACKASVDAGAAMAKSRGELLRTSLIPRPGDGTDTLISEYAVTVTNKKPAAPKKKTGSRPKGKTAPKGKK